jgi:hypothetical protein
MKPYINPYKSSYTDGTKLLKIQVRIPQEEVVRVRSVHPLMNGQETVLCVLWSKLVDFLYERNINSPTDFQRFEQELANAKLTSGIDTNLASGSNIEPHANSLRGSSVEMADSQTSARNEQGGTDRGSGQVAPAPGQSTKSSGTAKARSRRGVGRSGGQKGTEEKG